MGSVSLKIGDGTARFQRATFCSSSLHIIMLVSVLVTNLFALYAFTYTPSLHTTATPTPLLLEEQRRQQKHRVNISSLISEHVADILRQIKTSQSKLSQIERNLLGYNTLDLSKPNVSSELKQFLTRHRLPLGRDSRKGITEMVSSVAHSCAQSDELLSKYMSYKPRSICPDDADLAHKLISRRCHPLPRRRCLGRKMKRPGIVPFPTSLWKPVSAEIVGGWNGFDKLAFANLRGKNDFSINDVLSLSGGGIRIGFDIDGGSGNFAARMAEKGVTVITSTLNSNGNPVSEFVAARGLFPLEITPEQRFPFYNSVFDLVHTTNLFTGEEEKDEFHPERLEFLMFDIDRILRQGGLFWLDNYHCADARQKTAVTTLIEKFGYKKLKWVVGEKTKQDLPSGKRNSKILLLSAVLQKPTRS
ncbi:S-adenosyl-L-methionine-dependent methyltransferases superfamilyprotein [Zostera marina]|uniref:S-adenosyl-L-methionine-dependent methyltransferases superfamilyprotein n=1 Tax=Zostera marina TaxID=29655 RepID=A0A0K9P0P3_ZOSMR|nr:S-adenosyl-L-methionine-dependent methyltransferases superfamilyprotein [Zostera marina]